MSNLNKDTEKIFDYLSSNNTSDNILQMYDNYTYHIELCMIPKDKMTEYENILSCVGPFSNTLSEFFNKNKVIIADTSGCPRFNITSAKMKTFTQSGSIRTTDKSNVHVNGYMVETNLTIQEVFGFTLFNKMDFLSSILGYNSRHRVPVFLNIWFSGYENWKSENNVEQNDSQFMKIKDCIGNNQYIYRGIISEVKTTTSTSTETIYEVKFNSDNYSTDNKCFEACFSYSKMIEVDTNSINFLGDVASILEKQINENFLKIQPTAVARHIYDLEHPLIRFIIYDEDGSLIYNSYKNNLSNLNYTLAKIDYDTSFGVKRASLYREAADNLKEAVSSGTKALDNDRNNEVLRESVSNLYNQKLIADYKYKEAKWAKQDRRKSNKNEKEMINEVISDMRDNNKIKQLYGIEKLSSLNSSITDNITSNGFLIKDKKIKISCDGSSLDNIFNNILITYIDTVKDNSLSGIGACCNIVPHFLAEYEGSCYYNYDVEVKIIKIPGLEEVVKQQKNYIDRLTKDDVNYMDIPSMQLGFFEDLKNKNVPLKSYKYMYSGTDISVLEYNTDMNQLYYMDTGTSMYKNLLNNSMNKETVIPEGLEYVDSIVKIEDDIYNTKPNNIKYIKELQNKLLVRNTENHIYMEDIWNSFKNNEKNYDFVNEIIRENYKDVAILSNPITEINDTSTNVISFKKIAWNNIFTAVGLNATIKIIGDPYWLVPNIPYSSINYNEEKTINDKDSNIEYRKMTSDSQMMPVLLFSYVPFVEQQNDDTFAINKDYYYKIPYWIMEINSLFENGEFTQELVCTMPTQFLQNTSLYSFNNKKISSITLADKSTLKLNINGDGNNKENNVKYGKSVGVFFGDERVGREAVSDENGNTIIRNAYR